MKSSRTSHVVLAFALLLCFTLASCGSKLEGTYSNAGGGVLLELRSGGKAELTLNGESRDCDWKADDKNVTVTCGGDSVKFGLHDDGSLTGPFFVGVLRKSK